MLGFWSSCGAFGNVFGSFITSALLVDGVSWQNTFTCIGAILVVQTFVNYFFLFEPEDVGLSEDDGFKESESTEAVELENTITFWEALCYPNVHKNSFIFFCLKFEYHGLTSWLPLFIAETQEIDEFEISAAVAVFEIGTLVGAFLIGFISDLIKRRYLTLFIAVAIGSIFT